MLNNLPEFPFPAGFFKIIVKIYKKSGTKPKKRRLIYKKAVNVGKDGSMTDKSILRLLAARDEKGLTETEKKYGPYMTEISRNITSDIETAKECANEALLALWEASEGGGVRDLRAFIIKTVRNISVSRYRAGTRNRRGNGYDDLPFEELDECIPSGGDVEGEAEARRLADFIGEFVKKLPPRERTAFTARYFFACPLDETAKSLSMSEEQTRKLLYRIRQKLKKKLEREKWI